MQKSKTRSLLSSPRNIPRAILSYELQLQAGFDSSPVCNTLWCSWFALTIMRCFVSNVIGCRRMFRFPCFIIPLLVCREGRLWCLSGTGSPTPMIVYMLQDMYVTTANFYFLAQEITSACSWARCQQQTNLPSWMMEYPSTFRFLIDAQHSANVRIFDCVSVRRIFL